MASSITTTNIDVTFPVPGVDNDTQGFRNNFGAIVSALETAKSEISNLDIEQIGIINRLDNFSNPTTFRGSEITATVITSETINNSGDITAAKFFGDGRELTNLSVSNVRDIGNLTNLTVENLTASLVNGFTATVYIPTAPTSSIGTSTHKQGMIHANSTTVFICYRDYTSTTTNIWARITGLTGSW
jgi:hypothetical protein